MIDNAMEHDSREALAYQGLQPEQILDAVESLGFICDGRLLALNSYENRVYRVGVEGQPPVVVKFYRPHRWSDEAIGEEHAFATELAAAEVPVIAPCADADGVSLHRVDAFRFAVFPCSGGRAPELDRPDHLEQLGRFVARAHAVGATRAFEYRPALTVQSFGVESFEYLLAASMIPGDLVAAYESLARDLINRVEACFERVKPVRQLRLHGDCHPGNILWTDDGPHIVDLDDARSGPAIQDLWMFMSGERAAQTEQLHHLLEGYTQFNDFDARELHLIEALRTLRLLHYYAWLGRRWDDPAFPRAFPWFNSQRCWEDHILHLREQVALLEEPPLQWL